MEISDKDLKELERIGNRLLGLVDAIQAKPVEVGPQIAATVAKCLADRVCLACGRQVPAEEKMRRGLCDACFSTTRARIRRGDVRERDLVALGKITAEAGKPGRPARMDLMTAAENAEAYGVADDSAEARPKKAKQKGGKKA